MFSPVVWAGIVLAGISVLLFGASSALSKRSGGETEATPAAEGKREKKALPKASGKGAPAIDDDMADIEAILRKRGIT